MNLKMTPGMSNVLSLNTVALAMQLSSLEKRSVLALGLIFAVRLLGLFLILPVFAVYAQELRGADPTLLGLALGVYGLTQALLQIPFGMVSDRCGRKPVIAVGLVIFILGSVIAAQADSIHLLILGRSLQGAGAIGSTIMALVADLTREEHRTKAMAYIGLAISLAFGSAMVFSPLLNAFIHVEGIFWLTALLGAIAILLLYIVVPSPVIRHLHRDSQPVRSQFVQLLRHRELLRLNFGIFTLHSSMTALFIAVPLAFQRFAIPDTQQWWLYLLILIGAFISMMPFILMAEKKRKMKPVFLGAIALLLGAQLLFAVTLSGLLTLLLALYFFFTAFTLLEATLPSLISKTAPAASKGTAMGIYSTCQFLGIFIGGWAGGLLASQHIHWVFAWGIIVSFLWMLAAWGMSTPRHAATYLLNIGMLNATEAAHLTERLQQVNGVLEATIIPEEPTAYLKVDNRTVNKLELQQFSCNPRG